MKHQRALAVFFLCFLSASSVMRGQMGASELGVAVQYEQEKRYDDALRQYERIINSTDAAAEIKLEAKVRAGRLYLDEKNDIAKAVPLFEEGMKALGFRDIVALATVNSGKAMLAKAASKAELDSALSEFDTVTRTYASSPSVVEALIRGGLVMELQRKYEQAIINYQSVVFGFPQSPYATQAFERLGYTLARLGRIQDALGAYQNLQVRYQGLPAAASARKAATLLYRLFPLKSKSPVIFTSSVVVAKSENFKPEDPSKLVYLPSGDLTLVDKAREFVLPPGGPPRLATTKLADCTDSRGGSYQISQKTLGTSIPNSRPLTPYIKKPDKQEPFDEILACGISMYGDMVLSTKGPEGIYRVDMKTGESTPFLVGQKPARKMLLDSESNYYLLDPNGTNLTMTDSRGKPITSILAQAVGIKEFADFTFDTFDNLYLLDKQGKFVIVSIEQGKEIKLTTIHKQDIMEGAKPANNLRAIAVSPSGTVYVAAKESVLAFQ
jgi:tetratricopeptide (TPR) repeat protein